MKPAQREHRLRLFDEGVEAFRLGAVGDPPRAYLCPQCLRFVVREAVAEGFLTMEHVPPASVGGRRMLLTCKECNNIAGTKYEGHMADAEALRTFGTEHATGPVEATTVFEGIPNRGLLYFDGATAQHIGIRKRNHPNDLERLVELIPTIGDGAKVSISVSYDPKVMVLARIGWLRAAYLAAFSVLGYRYILRPALDPIREAIATAEMTNAPLLVRGEGRRGDRAIFAASGPEWLRDAIIVIQDRTVAILPSLRPDDGVLEGVRTRREANIGLDSLTIGTMLGWPTEPEYRTDRYVAPTPHLPHTTAQTDGNQCAPVSQEMPG